MDFIPEILARFINVNIYLQSIGFNFFFFYFLHYYFLKVSLFQNLRRGEPLKIVDGADSTRTYCYIGMPSRLY